MLAVISLLMSQILGSDLITVEPDPPWASLLASHCYPGIHIRNVSFCRGRYCSFVARNMNFRSFNSGLAGPANLETANGLGRTSVFHRGGSSMDDGWMRSELEAMDLRGLV